MPNVRAGLTAGVVEGVIYAFGGIPAPTETEAYSTFTDNWSGKTSLPFSSEDDSSGLGRELGCGHECDGYDERGNGETGDTHGDTSESEKEMWLR